MELLKNYKRHYRHKQVEFWKKEKIKIDEAEEGFKTWRTVGENIHSEEWGKYFAQLYNEHLWSQRNPSPKR